MQDDVHVGPACRESISVIVRKPPKKCPRCWKVLVGAWLGPNNESQHGAFN
jgi:hypothetical protein